MPDDTAVPHGSRGRRVLLAVVAVAFFVDMLLYGIVVPVLPSLATRASLENLGIGVVFACYGAAYFLVTPLAGWLTDRYGTRSVFLAGAVALTASTLVFGFAESLGLLVASRLLQGAGAAATWVAGYATLTHLFPRDQRGGAVGVASIGTALGVLLGPAAGGLLLETSGPRAPFVLAAGFTAAAGVALAVVLPSAAPVRSPHRGPTLADGAMLGLAAAWLVAGLAAGLGLGSVESTLPLDLQTRLGLSGSTIGVLFALTASAFIVTSQGAGRLSDAWRREPVLAVGWGILCAALALVGLPATVVGQAAAMVLLGVGLGVMIATIMPALSDALEAGHVVRPGTAAAAYNLSFSAGIMLGAPLAGWLTDALSFREATQILALGTLGCGVLAWQLHRRKRVACTPIG